MVDTGQAARRRNQRGEGWRLRGEILAAASRLIERTGTEEAITNRAVAREAGISAPSVAAHFTDRAEIVDAVVAAELDGLFQALTEGIGEGSDAAGRLIAVSRAYVRFGQSRPGHYRVLFDRRFLPDWDAEQRVMTRTMPVIDAVFELGRSAVQACIDDGTSASTDALADTLILWAALHGLVTLPAITSIPWTDIDGLVINCVTAICRLDHPGSGRPGPAAEP